MSNMTANSVHSTSVEGAAGLHPVSVKSGRNLLHRAGDVELGSPNPMLPHRRELDRASLYLDQFSDVIS